MPEPSPPSTTARVLGGRYRLQRPLARGGMAEVYEGHDAVLGRPVAVKVLHPHLAADEGFVERFRREAVAAARLAHPHIVSIFDTGTDGDTAYIVMELVRGQTLRDALEPGAPLPVAQAVRIARDVADALDCAHRNGLVHRDVKPGNILLEDAPGSPYGTRVKVTDFGIAKIQAGSDGDLTQTGAVIGTAKYLSPEQVEGRSPDARSDVYALGVVLYEMLTGRPPYAADTELATALQHVRATPTPPRRVASGIPKPVEKAVLCAMAKDPGDRFASAAAMRDVLDAIHLDDDAEPAVVRDPTPPGGIAPLPRRGRRAWAPAVLVAAVAIGALAVAASLVREPGGRGQPPEPRRQDRPVQPLAIASARSFDPEGDGSENQSEVDLATDGDPTTAWFSDRYNTRRFGGLKDGVGLVFTVGARSRLTELRVTSSVRGWAASVYVAAAPATSLAGWGRPVDAKAGIAGGATFDLKGTQGSAVLLWITDPGPGNKAEVADVALFT